MGAVVFRGQSVRPGKVVCVGKNYPAHIEEMASVPSEDMVVFMKPATSIGNELFAALDESLHYESEIFLLMRGGVRSQASALVWISPSVTLRQN